MEKFLKKLKNKENLSFEESKAAFEILMNGKASEDEIYSFLTLLSDKGEVSDEIAPLVTKFGDRVKVNKVLVTIKHLKTQKVEEAEFDIEAIERELMEKRHYTSTNRWIPTKEIKNGYVTNTRHTILITDAASLDYIVF